MNTDAILKDMMNAGSNSFKGDWPAVKDFAKIEFSSILNRLKDIAKAVKDPNNNVDIGSARHLVKAQINLAAQAIVGFATMTIVAVQKAIRAVLRVVKGAINTALDVAIL